MSLSCLRLQLRLFVSLSFELSAFQVESTQHIYFFVHHRIPMRTSFLFLLIVVSMRAAAAENAVSADWPRVLGPAHNCTTPESGLLRKFPSGGPRIVWEKIGRAHV